MADEGRFYVYKLVNKEQKTIYVGKGSGHRLSVQRRKFCCEGEIVAHFKSEAKAYQHERKLIAAWRPEMNKHPGGNGSKAVRRYTRRDAAEREMDRVGSRVYAARALLRFGSGLRKYLSCEQIDKIRLVAASGPA